MNVEEQDQNQLQQIGLSQVCAVWEGPKGVIWLGVCLKIGERGSE